MSLVAVLRQARLMSVLGLSFMVILAQACTSDGPEGQTEPVAPSEESTPYPEDPDMAIPEGGSLDDIPTIAEENPIGELTADPFDKPAGADGEIPDMPMAEDGLPIPDEGEPYAGSFEEPAPSYEPAPGTATSSGSSSPAASAPAGKVTRYVDAILLNVRARPTARAPIVRRLLGGAKIYVRVSGTWAEIRPGQWVHTRYLSASPTRKVSRTEAANAWKRSKYKDTWKPGKQ